MRHARARIGALFAFATSASALTIVACSGDDNSTSSGGNDASVDASSDVTTTQDGASRDSGGDAGPTDSGSDAAAPTGPIISAGDGYSCAIVGGQVECWGDNFYQELGHPNDGGAARGPTVPPVNASLLSAGWDHGCASDGTSTQCWGYDDFGQLDRADASRSVGPVVGLTGTVTGLAAGWFHTCALAGNDVSCWGENKLGQLGVQPDGSAFDGMTSVPLSGAADEVVVGIQFGCARLVSDHSVWCWGGNHMGELALPFDGGFSATPVRIGTLTGVLQITAGEGAACALLSDHTVTCWGRNASADDNTLGGLLGHDPTTDQNCSYGKCDPTPSAVPGLTNVSEIATGGGHTCAVTGGNVFCWGSNVYGQLGHDPSLDIDAGSGTDSIYSFTPTQVAGVTDVVHVATGVYHTCVSTSDQKVYCWGIEGNGELGSSDGAATSFTPLEVPGL